MSTVSTTYDHVHDHAHDDHTPHGWRRWLFATNHKDIGTMYLIFSFVSLLAGGTMALGIRLELFQPGLQFFRPEFFNQLTTMHGLVMVFGAIMPAFVGFANWMVPLQIGASDMAFARMNNFSFWILPVAATSWRRSIRRLDNLCSFDFTNGPWHGHGDFLSPFVRRIFHYGFDQHHRYHFEHARSWHDFDEDANVLLDLVDYCLLIDCCDACTGWRNHDGFNRPSLWDIVLLRCWRWRSSDVPAYFLVLWAPRGLHYDSSCVWDH